MEEWTLLGREFPTKDKASKAAGIIEITEARLSSAPNGTQYNIETDIFETEEGWRVKWRKVFAGYNSGCSKCGSCGEKNNSAKTGTKTGQLVEFKRHKQDDE